MAAVSRFAGLFNAIDFAYGCGDGFPPSLKVSQGSQAAGAAGTLTVGAGFTQLSDGTIVWPLNANAPINIGIGAGADLITPASTAGGMNSTQDAVTVTLTATHAHGAGDRIASGTFGLQEALNFASLMGGGQVILSGKWNTLAGGTTAANAMIAAATVPSGVTIWDNRVGGSMSMVQSAQVAVTNAQVLLLNTNGKEIIAAPGAGILIDVIDMVVEAIFGVAAFTAGSAIGLNYDTGTSAPCSVTIATTFLTTFSATQAIKVAGSLAVLAKTACVGKSVRLTAAGTEFANASNGVSTLLVTVNYRLISGL